MTETLNRDLGRYRPLLRVRAELIDLHPGIRVRFDYSDLVNETLHYAHQKLDQFRGQTEAELIGWLQRILEHRAIAMIRRERAQKRDVLRECSLEAAVEGSSVYVRDFLPGKGPSPSEHLQREELMVRVAWALNQLEAGQRQAFLARHMMDLPIADIATLMGRTEKAVAGLLLRGRKRLRELLGEESRDGMEGNHHAPKR
jgi:RNA polymerase sigma-70 factor (ECF subfamily)